MNKTTINSLIYSVLILFFCTSFWLFARFTVDDAFISWRYGKNLVDFGIWNYNPSYLDITQAYTNPIFAFLSIIPNILKVDVVLFFKIFSVVNALLFAVFFIKKTDYPKMTLAFFALPATMIHLFSGLETFFFISLVVTLFIFLYENQFKQAVITTICLFLTRPEAWILSLLVPFYFLVRTVHYDFSSIRKFSYGLLSKKQYEWKPFFISISILGLFLLVFLLVHLHHFGYLLPNTFYIKTQSKFTSQVFIRLFLVISPLFLLVLARKYSLFITFYLFFLSITIVYSNSALSMNYAERFEFHLLAPIFFILLYMSTRIKYPRFVVYQSKKTSGTFIFSPTRICFVFAILLLSSYAIRTMNINTIINSDYYPRALQSHAELGKTLNQLKKKYHITSFSFGDAGMTAYHSQLQALDNIGLGSSLVAQAGDVTPNILESYKPEIILFHSRPNKIRLSDHKQGKIYKWATSRGYNQQCEVLWRQNYTITIFSKKIYKELASVCDTSLKANNNTSRKFILKDLINSPFKYWHQ